MVQNTVSKKQAVAGGRSPVTGCGHDAQLTVAGLLSRRGARDGGASSSHGETGDGGDSGRAGE